MAKQWAVRNKIEGTEIVVEHVGKMEYSVTVTGHGIYSTRRQLGEAMSDAQHVSLLTREQVAETFAYRA